MELIIIVRLMNGKKRLRKQMLRNMDSKLIYYHQNILRIIKKFYYRNIIQKNSMKLIEVNVKISLN
jgi:hypothetical protein